MTLTLEDIKALEAPMPLNDHEAREKGEKNGKKQYLFYINQEGIIPLLNSLDPDWSWDVLNVHFSDRYVSVTGRLTIKGVARDGVGGNSPNSKTSPVDEDTVKGAETDALKRAALRFGVGLYLRSSPLCWVDANLKPWEAEKVALAEFANWYKREFGAQGTQNGNKPQPPPQRQQAPQNGAGGAQKPPLANTPPTDTTAKGDGGSSAGAEFFPPQIEGATTIKLPPQIGTLDMQALGKLAQAEGLVKGRNHYADLITKMQGEGWIRDAMTADQVIEAIRTHYATKDLQREAVGK